MRLEEAGAGTARAWLAMQSAHDLAAEGASGSPKVRPLSGCRTHSVERWLFGKTHRGGVRPRAAKDLAEWPRAAPFRVAPRQGATPCSLTTRWRKGPAGQSEDLLGPSGPEGEAQGWGRAEAGCCEVMELLTGGIQGDQGGAPARMASRRGREVRSCRRRAQTSGNARLAEDQPQEPSGDNLARGHLADPDTKGQPPACERFGLHADRTGDVERRSRIRDQYAPRAAPQRRPRPRRRIGRRPARPGARGAVPQSSTDRAVSTSERLMRFRGTHSAAPCLRRAPRGGRRAVTVLR